MSDARKGFACEHGSCWRNPDEPHFKTKYLQARHEKLHHNCQRSCPKCRQYPHKGQYKETKNKRPRIESAKRNVQKQKQASKKQRTKHLTTIPTRSIPNLLK